MLWSLSPGSASNSPSGLPRAAASARSNVAGAPGPAEAKNMTRASGGGQEVPSGLDKTPVLGSQLPSCAQESVPLSHTPNTTYKGATGWASSQCRVSSEGRSAGRGLCTHGHTPLLPRTPTSLPRSRHARMPTSFAHSDGRWLLPLAPLHPSSISREAAWVAIKSKTAATLPGLPLSNCLIRSEPFVPLRASVSLSRMVPTSLDYGEG